MSKLKDLFIIGKAKYTHRLRDRVAKTAEGWDVKLLDLPGLAQRRDLHDLTILEQQGLQTNTFEEALKLLSQKVQHSPSATFVVLVLPQPPTKNERYSMLQRFAQPERVTITLENQDIQDLLDDFAPKIELLQSPRIPSDYPLDALRKTVQLGSALREKSGALSAKLIAELYGVSLAELSRWLGRDRQRISKTPTAASLQEALSPLERIARLRLILSDEDFRRWLRMANQHLGNQRPLDVVAKGKAEVVADLASDMITGRPG